MFDLEETTSQVAAEQLTSVEKAEEPTTPKAASTIRTYTQRELDEAVGKGRASTQSQLSLQKAETEKYKAENTSRQLQIESLRREVEEALSDDPERRQAYISKIASSEREQKIADREAEAERKFCEGAMALWQAGMGLKAQELAGETPGLDPKWLIEGCQTEAEMEVKALRFKLTQEPGERTPKFVSAVSSGGRISNKDLSPDELFIRGFEKLRRK